MLWKIGLVGIIALAFFVAAAILYGTLRWQSDTRKLHSAMEDAQLAMAPASFDPRELEELPGPVQRYFLAVLREGQPLITAVEVEHTGTFNMSEGSEQWKAFRSTQRVVIRRPGFVWDARIRMAPGITAHVHDAYIAGEGVLTAKLFGFLTVMKQPGTPELAHGELMRFLAEAAWYPTALLPGQGVTWEPIDDTRAAATLTDGETTVTLTFHFDDDGLISTVHSDGRYRAEADAKSGAPVSMPWQGRFWGYEKRNEMFVPLHGEVEWLLDDGPKPYWRGHLKRIQVW